MKNSGNILLLIFVTVGIIAISVGGYFWWRPSSQTSQIACTMEAKLCPDGTYVGRSEPNCEFAICPSPADQTANWKTYTNSKYNFSFKYPSTYPSYDLNNGQGISIECGCMFFDWLNFEVVPSKLSPEVWWESSGRSIFSGKAGINAKVHPEAFKIQSIGFKTISGINLYEVNAETSSPSASPTKAIGGIRVASYPFRVLIFSHGDYLMVITNYDTVSDPKLFDQILSTFRFLK